MNYLEEKTDGESKIHSITHGEQSLPVVAQVSLAGTAPNAPPTLKDLKFWTAEEKKTQKIDRLARSLLIQGLPNDIYSLIDSNDTAKELSTIIARRKDILLKTIQRKVRHLLKKPLLRYLISDFESEYEYKTLEYYDNSTNYGLFMDNDDDQEIFHDAIEFASENFNKNHVVSQKDHDQSEVDHNDSEENDHLIDKLINKFNKKIAKCHKRIEKANQQSKDLENQNKNLQDKYDVLQNQVSTFEEKNNEFNEQIKVLNENNDDFLAQTDVLQEQLKVKHVVIDSHTKCQAQYAKLEEERYQYMIRYSALYDNDKQHMKKIDEQEILFDKMSHLDNLSSVRRPKHSGVIWKKKGSSNTSNVNLSYVSHSKLNKDVKRYSCKDLLSCNNSHHVDTRSAYACNDAINVSCNSRLYASCDVNDLFVFDDESIRKSQVSKMPFRKTPRDYLNVHSRIQIIQIYLWIINSGCSKHMTRNRALLTNFVEKFLRTVRFGNNDFAVIAGYGDVVIGLMTIKKVYYVEGLGHNLFSVRQFCDKGLEVAFRKSTCFVRNKNGVYFLTGDRSLNLYTISLNEIASDSLTCLLAKASSLNFPTINNLVKNNLVRGLPKMKFEKDHLYFACEQGKIHRKHHMSKTAFASNKPLYLLHMDLCGPMRVKSINESDMCWLLAMIIHGTHGTPQQNGIVERRNRTFVEAARTMLTFVNLTLFLWAEAITTACFTQNHLIIHKRFNKTPYELINKRKPNIKFFHVFGCGCYLLNDYDDVGKLKEKGDIGVVVGYSKEFAAFRVYNKRTRKIHESVNVNFDEILEMAFKQFSLEPSLSNLNETGKSSNLIVSQVLDISKKDMEGLFHNFYNEYFDASKITKSLTTNVETSNDEISSHEEVFHENSDSFP
uniref:Integrase catalytic domain-containing protein n=1 Tax=Tanacetum cinerariifolium TaxID=118510 RepID=A0A6L2KXJ2_TANCI|nr:hypothetical protein [Tanacetum cinerariifolium]